MQNVFHFTFNDSTWHIEFIKFFELGACVSVQLGNLVMNHLVYIT